MTRSQTHRQATQLVVGSTGPEAVVSGRAAALLMQYAGLDRYRREHRGEDPEVDQTLIALTVVALQFRNSATGTKDAPTPELDAQYEWLSTTQAAEALNMTDRAVRKAIREKRLNAVHVGRAYRISREQLALFKTRTGGRTQ